MKAHCIQPCFTAGLIMFTRNSHTFRKSQGDEKIFTMFSELLKRAQDPQDPEQKIGVGATLKRFILTL